MKTYRIIRIDMVTKEVEPIENIKTDDKDKLKNRLLELQEGYCEDNEKPEIDEKVFTSNGKKINTLIASSEVDFCYAAPLGVIK